MKSRDTITSDVGGLQVFGIHTSSSIYAIIPAMLAQKQYYWATSSASFAMFPHQLQG